MNPSILLIFAFFTRADESGTGSSELRKIIASAIEAPTPAGQQET